MCSSQPRPQGQDLVEELTAIVGASHCVTPPADSPYLADGRGLFRGLAAAIVKPATTSEVAAVVRACARRGNAVVPHGGNTGLCGGTAPSRSGSDVVLSLERMDRVRTLDRVNDTIIVEAGMILGSVQAAAAAAGRHFPLSLGAEGSCQIGGNIATNAGGNGVLRYGNARDLVLGLEVVLADGTVVSDLRGLRKNNAGYDLKQLFIGAEGTLGIVTAATLKLFPPRRQVETAFLAMDDLDSLIALYLDARDTAHEFLTAFELTPRIGLDMAMRHVHGIVDPLERSYPQYVLVELSSTQTLLPLRQVMADLLERNLAEGRIADGTVAASLRDSEMFWRIREGCVEAQRIAGPSFKHDVSVPVSAIPDFIRTTTAEIDRLFPDAVVVPFGHVGDGNIHFNVCVGTMDRAEFASAQGAIETIVYEAVAAHGGSFSAEHGIGLLKRDALISHATPAALSVMGMLKQSFDPRGTLNPGKVLKHPAIGAVPNHQSVRAFPPSVSPAVVKDQASVR